MGRVECVRVARLCIWVLWRTVSVLYLGFGYVEYDFFWIPNCGEYTTLQTLLDSTSRYVCVLVPCLDSGRVWQPYLRELWPSGVGSLTGHMLGFCLEVCVRDGYRAVCASCRTTPRLALTRRCVVRGWRRCVWSDSGVFGVLGAKTDGGVTLPGGAPSCVLLFPCRRVPC